MSETPVSMGKIEQETVIWETKLPVIFDKQSPI